MSGRLAFPLSAVQATVQEAWQEAFMACAQTLPHDDDDPDGAAFQAFQRRFLVTLVGQVGGRLAEQGVAAGFWPSVEAFFEFCDQVDAGGAA